MSSATQKQSSVTKTIRHQIIVVGGGAAGITVTAQLLNKNSSLDIAIVEPSQKHYYQPAWTLVGGGVFKLEDTEREERDLIPKGVTWIKDSVAKLDPDNNAIFTIEGTKIEYDYLILAPGIQIDWHLIAGLKEALGKDGVTSNYSKQYAPYTWETLQNFKGGTAIFTYPNTPIKCGGAPQKIMYLADDHFKSKSGVGTNTKVIYCTAGGKMFPVPEYCDTLEQIIDRRKIEVKYRHNLKAIDPENKEAIFEAVTEEGVGEVRIKYDMIHVAPPMSAPDFIKESPLAMANNPLGWVDVDRNTLQHNSYPNVFSLGDASSLPTSKTAAAIRKQAPALVASLLNTIAARSDRGNYQGYTCCPLVTGYGKTLMAEFDYTNTPTPSFPIDQTKEHYLMWLAKKYLLPWLYWNRMLKGSGFEGDLLNKKQERVSNQ
ncbi:MAG: FAD/NAD(P)-binding oxidoreductase [Prochloraceae cyanobacterium]|nr:FAD/NAD(P)-binding oxidoreductase [Prochloraceae cyanobacterium]